LRGIAPKQSRDVGDYFASFAMTTESWSLADLGSHAVNCGFFSFLAVIQISLVVTVITVHKKSYSSR